MHMSRVATLQCSPWQILHLTAILRTAWSIARTARVHPACVWCRNAQLNSRIYSPVPPSDCASRIPVYAAAARALHFGFTAASWLRLLPDRHADNAEVNAARPSHHWLVADHQLQVAAADAALTLSAFLRTCSSPSDPLRTPMHPTHNQRCNMMGHNAGRCT